MHCFVPHAGLGQGGSCSPCWCREQEEQQARREELRRQEDEAAALLESHGLCALRGFPELAAQCEGTGFRIQRECRSGSDE